MPPTVSAKQTLLMKKTPLIAAPALISVAIIWGAAFVLMKPAIEKQPIFDFLATRFTIAVVIMILIRPSVLKLIRGDIIKFGFPLGAILGAGYITQTIALQETTAAITGFLTGLYVVLTPIFAWLAFRQKIARKVWLAVALATAGLALISITGVAIELGQIWGILCAILFAVHIVGLGAWSPGRDAYALTVVQLAAAGVVCWIGALADGYQAPPSDDVWFAVLFTAVLATALAFFVQTWAQSIMDASRVAIILTSEVVFAAAISVAVGQEVLTLKTLLGGALMMAAMLLVEWPSRKTRAL
jgi:drug/metabolite transporter (DMT)-like permease